MDFVEKVCLFNQIADHKNEFDPRKVALYISLQLEELAEKIEAIGERETPKNKEIKYLLTAMKTFSQSFRHGHFDDEVAQIDKTKALDADIDLAVVALGGAYCLGADVNGACHEVADSNLSKFELKDGEYKVYKDSSGKVAKSPSYRPPKLEKYLK